MASGDKTFPPKPSLHPMSIAGFNQKTATSYDAKRPEYSNEAVDMILKHMNLDNMETLEDLSADILELGAGTGKFTKSIYCKLKKTLKYVATDPMEGFLELAKRNCPRITTRICSAENLHFPDSSVRVCVEQIDRKYPDGWGISFNYRIPDAYTTRGQQNHRLHKMVSICRRSCSFLPGYHLSTGYSHNDEWCVTYVVAAQCFHWFASEASLKEIHRVLVPDGKLICLWNTRDISIPWIRAATEFVREYDTDNLTWPTSGEWKKAFENCTIFKQEIHGTPTGTMIKGDKQRITDYFMTISVIVSLPEDERNRARQRFLDILDKFHPGKPDTEDWILPFTTQVYIYAKV